MLIAIDHGNKQIKTINCEPFTSGLLESDTQPFGKDVLMYKGKYYQVTDQRIPYRKDKTEDERFFILSLFAIAREIEEQGFFHPGVMRIQLAVGLPPAYYDWSVACEVGDVIEVRFRCEDEFGLGYDFLFQTWVAEGETADNQASAGGQDGSVPLELYCPE